MGVKFSHFLFWECIRTLLTCPVSVWVGFRFGPYAHEIIKPYKDWLFLVMVLVVAVWSCANMSAAAGFPGHSFYCA